jgi:HK97 family phage prohead protease
MTVDAAQRATDLVTAAAARAAAYGGIGGEKLNRTAPPQEVGSARLVPCQAQLRAKLETRGDQEMYRLAGTASVTDKPYRMWDMFGEYDEIVERDAFAKTLAAGPDVAFLLNHRGMTMARTTNGTLELSMGDDGLRSTAWLNPKRQDVKDLVLAIEDGNITEMSFAFMLEHGQWNDDFTEFRITQLDINRGDVSAVNYGANPYTSIAARSREILSDLDRLPIGAARAALDRLQARDDLRGPLRAPTVAEKASAVSSGAATIDYYEKLLSIF